MRWLSLIAVALIAADRPNVILVITDDQGYGDLSCHGNPVLKTPNIDKLAAESVQLKNFYVNPVCSPTRASLLTGRYYYRTGVVDTHIGRSMMRPDEITLAEVLAANGYRTGIFGKWHLGDCFPLRPIDQGFGEALVCRGGGLTQPADPPGNRYHDPVLMHNGRPEKCHGYCSDIYTDAAIRFVETNRDRPFFAYVPYNCPHTPLEDPPGFTKPYLEGDLAESMFPKIGFPIGRQMPREELAKIYGMVANIDWNLGRLFAKLDELNLSRDTIVVFLTDNGPQQPRFNGGLRNRKGTVYDGGIRVPGFIRWPAKLPPGSTDVPAAHIDLMPTLLAACGLKPPADRVIDGISLLPYLRGKGSAAPERTLYFQWHRGDEPQLHRACAARGPRWKLVQPAGLQGQPFKNPAWELYDLLNDPFEQHDRAESEPKIVTDMVAGYERWFADVTRCGFDPPRIILGSPMEPETMLTRQDWRGSNGWGPNDLGYWEVTAGRAGRYEFVVRVQQPQPDGAAVKLRAGGGEVNQPWPAGELTVRLTLEVPAGDTRVEAEIRRGGKTIGARDVTVRRLD